MKNGIWLALGLIFVVSSLALGQTKTTRTITNFDLEKYKERRERAEADYRENYKKLGMPSPEELEQRNAESKRQLEELSQRLSIESQQNQNYWQSRSNALRYEIYNINAQINYLNGQIGTLPNQNQVFLSPSQVNTVTYYGYGQRHYAQPSTIIRPIDNIQTVTNASAANPNPFYGTSLYPAGVKLVIGQNSPKYVRRGHGRIYGGGYNVQYPVNSQRDELVSRLQYLGQVRAGLLAQWDNLVDEARRAGVKITF